MFSSVENFVHLTLDLISVLSAVACRLTNYESHCEIWGILRGEMDIVKERKNNG